MSRHDIAEINFDAAAFDGTIPDRFSVIVARHRNRLAVATQSFQWTYETLDAVSDQLAVQMLASLRDADATLPVALLLDHDAPLIAAILATLKIGRPYVVLDPTDVPARRIATYESSGAALIAYDVSLKDEALRLAGSRCPSLNIAQSVTLFDVAKREKLDLRFQHAIKMDTIASITFTSGTTGKPKGVCQSHRTTLHHWQNYASTAGLTPDDRISLLTPCHLAASRSSLWGALLTGAALFPFDLRTHGVNALPAWIASQRLTLLHCVPAIFRTLASFVSPAEPAQPLADLRLLRLGGESIFADDFSVFKRHTRPSCQLLVSFSSTETGTVCYNLLDHGSRVNGSSLPMGQAAAGMKVRLLDGNGRPVPPQETGRIYVSSRHLPQGYWRDPELTRARFAADPDDKDMCRFDTGDLGRFDEEGRLIHCGRADDRIKINGRRVDPAEVEGALLQLDSVREAAVVAQHDDTGSARLVAYIISPPGKFPAAGSLRRQLREHLPDHMMPADFVSVNALPRTAGGKINRSRLSDSKPSPDQREKRPPPKNGQTLEAQIAGLWQEVLGKGSVGIHDDFHFDLGGTSLQSAKVIVRLSRILGRQIPLQTLIQHRTAYALAEHLQRSSPASETSSIVRVQSGQGDRLPFFFVHGDIVGAGLYCSSLARSLGEEQPFYALAPMGYGGRSQPISIEGMARCYVRDIRAIQSCGPYLLGGFCNGGVTAFEIARQLRQVGEQVKVLALIRARVGQVRWPGIRRAIHGICRAMEIDVDREANTFWRIHDHLLRFHQQEGVAMRAARIFELWSRLRAKRNSKSTLPARTSQGVQASRAADSFVDTTTGTSTEVRTGDIMRLHVRAMKAYLPGRYDGRVHLFWPEEDRRLLGGDPSAGWRRFVREYVSDEVPGGHFTCVTAYHGALANRLKRVLLEAQSVNGSRDGRNCREIV